MNSMTTMNNLITRITRMCCLPGVALAFAFATTASATDPFAYDSFEYPASPSLQSANGGMGWAGAWADVGVIPTGVNATGLTWPDLQTAGGGAGTDASASFELSVYQRALSSYTAPQNTIYVSFLLRPDAGFGTGGGLRFGNWPMAMWVGAHPANYVYGLMTSNGLGDDSNVPVVQGETVLLVARLVKNLNNSVSYSLYVNPTVAASQPAFPDAAYTISGALPQALTLVNDGGFTTDEIRVGPTWSSVLPSPPVCTGDFNEDGTVDGADLGFLVAFWGLAGADLDGDGDTNGADLGLLLSNWGGCS